MYALALPMRLLDLRSSDPPMWKRVCALESLVEQRKKAGNAFPTLKEDASYRYTLYISICVC